MISISKLKYYLYFYRYNILVPGTIGGIILADYLHLKKKRLLAVEKARRLEGKI
jgi:hypothetical protein